MLAHLDNNAVLSFCHQMNIYYLNYSNLDDQHSPDFLHLLSSLHLKWTSGLLFFYKCVIKQPKHVYLHCSKKMKHKCNRCVFLSPLYDYFNVNKLLPSTYMSAKKSPSNLLHQKCVFFCCCKRFFNFLIKRNKNNCFLLRELLSEGWRKEVPKL